MSSISSAILMSPFRHLEGNWLKSKCAKNIVRYRMGRSRSEEFRQEAVRIALTSGLTRRQFASGLGVSPPILNVNFGLIVMKKSLCRISGQNLGSRFCGTAIGRTEFRNRYKPEIAFYKIGFQVLLTYFFIKIGSKRTNTAHCHPKLLIWGRDWSSRPYAVIQLGRLSMGQYKTCFPFLAFD